MRAAAPKQSRPRSCQRLRPRRMILARLSPPPNRIAERGRPPPQSIAAAATNSDFLLKFVPVRTLSPASHTGVILITALSGGSAILYGNTLLFKRRSRIHICTGSSGLFARHRPSFDAAAILHQRRTKFGVVLRDSRRSGQAAESGEAVARVHCSRQKMVGHGLRNVPQQDW